MSADAKTLPRRADIVGGGVWVAIGIAIIVGSWRMDRLESQGVPWFTAPGLVPGVLGILITIAALGIVLRALRRRAASATPVSPVTSDDALAAHGDARDSGFGGRALLTLGLCVGFAGGLVGRVPFWIAAAIYLFLHIFLLQLPERRARGDVVKGIAVAAVIAMVAAFAISTVFQEIFLVRLP